MTYDKFYEKMKAAGLVKPFRGGRIEIPLIGRIGLPVNAEGEVVGRCSGEWSSLKDEQDAKEKGRTGP